MWGVFGMEKGCIPQHLFTSSSRCQAAENFSRQKPELAEEVKVTCEWWGLPGR
jgi:hypothetical protein